jgi:hypothetical protein
MTKEALPEPPEGYDRMESLRGGWGLAASGAVNHFSLREVGLSVGDSNTVLSCAVGSSDAISDSEQATKVTLLRAGTHVSLFGLLAISIALCLGSKHLKRMGNE